MEEEDIDRAVMAYLKKKGFKDAERVLVEERNKVQNNNVVSLTDPNIGKQILSFAQLENVPMRYQEGYKNLRMWAYTSLDLYKHELLRVLYPAFIHCFLDLVAQGHTNEARNFFHTFREDHEIMNLRDLQKLEGVLSPAHLQEMEFARSLRQSKVNIKICEYSYELLLQHLQKAQSVIMLGLINEHINFQVSPGQPSPILDDTDAVSMIGANQDNSQQINQKEVRWGLLEDSIEDRIGKAGGLLSEADKFDGQNRDVDVEDNKRKSVESGKQGPKKLKKDKLVGAPGKNIHPDTSTVSAAPRVKSELPLPAMYCQFSKFYF
ncbi:hypothetical protein ZOSMA_69G00010 [Zostera marina]|uniref:TFIID subunit TAF5 NTD2 domain-containing protein n=1 Tax=Zostera marina TaxID=29655 RepID=A0A0K9NRA7_ZOSMR|nr:hypothetical protein ZOSMA_69G00010 [Zostera marina]